jgi:hypothetical protein
MGHSNWSKGLVPAVLVAGVCGLAVVLWLGVGKQAADGDPPPKVQVSLFLRVRDQATAHAVPNVLEVADRMGSLAVEAHVLASAGDGGDDLLAACATYQGGKQGLRFIVCRQSMGRGNDDWAACAEEAGLDKGALERCANEEGGASLLAASEAEAERLGVLSTPAVFVNGRRVDGDGTRAAVGRAVCDAIEPAPDLCAQEASRPSGEFAIVVMTDSRCLDCRAPFWFRRLQMLFPSADVRIVDVGTGAGRAQYDAVAPGLLPAVLLDARVEKDPGFARLRRELLRRGDGYQLSPDTVRPLFDPAR